MSFNDWASWFFSIILTSIHWLVNIEILSVPVLYILLAIFIMGVVIRAIPFRA